VYFIGNKSETFETFKKIKVMVEKIMKKDIRFLRLDKSGEYISNEFKSYCNNHEIRIILTA
jgi:Ran GTPase-activating protein (RanGAP) involved in mRNA processing and transport